MMFEISASRPSRFFSSSVTHQLKLCGQAPWCAARHLRGSDCFCSSGHQITMRTMKNSGRSNHFGRGVCVTKETYHQPTARMSKIGVYVSQHDLSSEQVLVKWLLFLWINRLVFDNQVGVIVVFSGTSRFFTLEDVSDVTESLWHKMEYRATPKFSPQGPPTVWEERRRDAHTQQSMQRAAFPLRPLRSCSSASNTDRKDECTKILRWIDN